MKKMVVANWKMNMTSKKAKAFFREFKFTSKKVKVVFATPFTLFTDIKNQTLSAQDVSPNSYGAFTGQISATMLAEKSVKFCLVGHSERRIYNFETDQDCNDKIKQLQSKNITPILCIGENALERSKGQTFKILKKQLNLATKGVDYNRLIIAYEPVWAISTFQKNTEKPKTASTSDIKSVHHFIKKYFKSKHVRVLYGGSINEKNVKDICKINGVDGLLVGSASQSPKSLSKIISNYS